MKQKLDIVNQLPLAVTAAHGAYYGQQLAIKMEGSRELISSVPPPEDVLIFDPLWLARNPGGDRGERMRLFSAAERLRRRALYNLVLPASVHMGKRGRMRISLREALGPELICEARDLLLDPPLDESGCPACPAPTDLIRAVQQWKGWDAFEIDGWVHENVEHAADELEAIWRPMVAIAMRLKRDGAVPAEMIQSICRDIFGLGLRQDPEIQAVCEFYYKSIVSDAPMETLLIDQIPYALALNPEAEPEESLHLWRPLETLEVVKKMESLDTGADMGAAAARLLMTAYNGNYCVAQGKLCNVSPPVALESGNWKDVSKAPEVLHPLPDDYAFCARITLHFLLSGFVWAAMGQGNPEEEARNVDALADEHWIPLLFKLFYVLAEPTLDTPDLALKQAAAIYVRLVALRGWYNPQEMRDRAREIFRETYRILARHRKEVTDLEEGIRYGMLLGPADILSTCGPAKDGRFVEDPRYGMLMEYQRERAWRHFEYHFWMQEHPEAAAGTTDGLQLVFQTRK